MHQFVHNGGQKTLANSRDVDFAVLMFKCHRNRVTSKTTTELEWKLQCHESKPIHISVHVEKNLMGTAYVRITCNGETLFPKGWGGNNAIRKPGRLVQDFRHVWPFRGLVKGIGIERAVEIRQVAGGAEKWFPGTLIRQRDNDEFDVIVEKPSNANRVVQDKNWIVQEECSTCVHMRDVRDALTKRPYERVVRNAELFMPYENTLEGITLSLDGNNRITDFLGRPTPPRTQTADRRRLRLEVTKDRSRITANVGHNTLKHHVLGIVRAVHNNPQRAGLIMGFGSKSWVIRIGDAEHTIAIERKFKTTKMITLTVDGEVLIEAKAEDLRCTKNLFVCIFRFFGERHLDFHLSETDTDGYPLDDRCIVTQRHRFEHICKVYCQDLSDLSKAVLSVNDVEFRHLEQHITNLQEADVICSPSQLEAQYGLVVPFKVNTSAISKAGRAEPGKAVAFANGTSFANGATISGAGYATANAYNYSNFMSNRPLPYKFPTPKYEPGLIERLVMCQCRGCENWGNDANDVSGESKPVIDIDVSSLMAPWSWDKPESQSISAVSDDIAGIEQHNYDLIRPSISVEHSVPPPLGTQSSPTGSPKRKAKAKAKGKATNSSFRLSTGPAGNIATGEAGSAVTGTAFRAALDQPAPGPSAAHSAFGTSGPGPGNSYLYSPLPQGEQDTPTPYQEQTLYTGVYAGDSHIAQDLSNSYTPFMHGQQKHNWYSEASSQPSSREHSRPQDDPAKVHVL